MNEALTAADALTGVPVATVVVALLGFTVLALHRRWIVLGRELESEQEERAVAQAALMEAHATEVEAMRASFDALRADRNWWRDTALRALDLGERVARTSAGP